MEFLLFCLLYAFWENGSPAPSLSGWLFPLAFLLLAPLVHCLRIKGKLQGNTSGDGPKGDLDLHFSLTPLGETWCFPARLRWFCLGFAALLAAYLWGTMSALSTLSAGGTISSMAGLLLRQLSVWGLFLLPVLYVLLSRGTVSLFGDIFFAGEMVILGGIGRAHSICSDVDAFPTVLGWSTLPWLVITLVCAASLALFLRGKRQDRPSLA